MAQEDVKTAWGKPHITMGKSGANGAMCAELEDVGFILEDSTSLEQTKGDVKELYGEGHELVDKMEFEGTWTLKFTLIKTPLAQLAKLYGLSESADKLAMKTTVVSEPRSYKVDPLLEGAIGVELPYCYTSINPKFATAEGWTIEVEVTTMIPTDGTTAPATFYKKKASEAA